MYRMNQSEADKWVCEAEQKLSLNTGIMRFFFGGQKKIDDAIECYKKAGNLYKISKNWAEAADCYSKAATLTGSHENNNKHQAALDYEQAAICFKKINAQPEAEKNYLKSIDIYLDLGRFNTAAKMHENIAGMYENESEEVGKMLYHYEKAADFYKGEESSSSANRCLLKIAQHSAENERYEQAIHIYEKIGTYSLKSSLLKYGAKEYFFKAAICRLCLDPGETGKHLEKYVKIYPAFGDSREYKFCSNLIKNIEEQNVDGLTDVIKDYDSMQTLDPWYTTLLLRIKRKLADEPDLR
nr:alpha-soluble NSF attachment protein-like [Onthophagus taurus]